MKLETREQGSEKFGWLNRSLYCKHCGKDLESREVHSYLGQPGFYKIDKTTGNKTERHSLNIVEPTTIYQCIVCDRFTVLIEDKLYNLEEVLV